MLIQIYNIYSGFFFILSILSLQIPEEPNNLRVETILSEEIKRYINNNNLKGKPKHISIEDECFIGECKDLSVIGKLEIRTK